MKSPKPIVTVCGKGGVGKTVVTALMARALLARGVRPILLIDADPVGGLTSALGERGSRTLAEVRAEVIGTARHGDERTKQRVAEKLDYMVFEALLERDDHAFLAMGRSTEKGCFCPANTLLRKAIEVIVDGFAITLIDAEAGIEQINRQVTDRTTLALVVVDGSVRSHETLGLITEMVGLDRVAVVENRAREQVVSNLPSSLSLVGRIPEDPAVQALDAQGTPLSELPEDSPARKAAADLVSALGLVGKSD